MENHRDFFVENMENHRENCEIFESKIAKTSFFLMFQRLGNCGITAASAEITKN